MKYACDDEGNEFKVDAFDGGKKIGPTKKNGLKDSLVMRVTKPKDCDPITWLQACKK